MVPDKLWIGCSYFNREMRMACIHLHEQLEIKAKELWRSAGCPLGRDIEFWNDAERQIVGYTKEEFNRLYYLYEHFYFLEAPIVLSGSDEQVEALNSWGWQTWNMWTTTIFSDMFPDPYFCHSISCIDFSKPRPKRVSRFFKSLEIEIKEAELHKQCF